MGIFTNLFAKAPATPLSLPTTPPPTPTCSFGGALDTVGESFYGAALAATVGDAGTVNVVAVLLPEPDNPHDKDAVGVYVENRKVGHLAATTAHAHRRAIIKAWETHGVCAVEGVAIFDLARGVGQVLLEPARMGPMSQPGIAAILAQAGFYQRAGDAEGFTVRADGDRFQVFWSGSDWKGRDEAVPAMAKTLRNAGLKARVARNSRGYPYLSVTGLE